MGEMLIEYRLGTFYNATPGNAAKQKVKQWAREVYPRAYEDLMKCGMYKIKLNNPEDEELHQFTEEETYFNIGPLGRDPKP